MNLWAIQTVRKSHSKEILSAKILDIDSMNVTELANDLLIGALVHGGITVNNLAVQNNKIVLVGYDKTLKEQNAKMYMHRVRRNDRLIESFVIALRGYKAVYEFIADNPIKRDKAIHMIGTVSDLDALLDTAGVDWDGYGVFNGIITNKTWAHEDNGRYKIMKYIESTGGHEEFCDQEISKIADLRSSIKCEYCQLRLINGLPVIVNIKFDSDEAEIPDGVYMLNKSFGGAYMITLPKSIGKLGEKCFELDNDILQINFEGPVQNIPKGFARATNLQILEYPEKFKLESIDEYAFAECEDLHSDLLSQVEYIKKCAFLDTSIKKVIIPYCKEIGPGAFKDCYKLETVKLGDNIIIKEYAFADCAKLSNIDLKGATFIGKGAFKNCKKIKDVILKKGTVVEENAFHKNTTIHWV